MSVRRYAILIEEGATNYSGYVPELPIRSTAGASPEEVEANLHEAIAALNDAMTSAEELAAEKLGGITGSLNIQGLM